jgi:cobalt/nickel transport protein
MNRAVTSALVLGLVTLAGGSAQAHFNMLLPQVAMARAGQAVSFVYQWGHPFEHELFEAPVPESLIVLAPSGKQTNLKPTLTPIKLPGADNRQTGAFRLSFTPDERGDHVFLLTTPPIWMEEDKEFLQDTVKVILHVQAQNGWDRVAGQAYEVVPLTRPYGLQPGMLFRGQVLAQGGKPIAGALVEIERYNPKTLKQLPPDEFRTYTVKTDSAGIAAGTLTDPGWWCITAHAEEGKRERNGKTYPLRRRASVWVFVDERVGPGAEK